MDTQRCYDLQVLLKVYRQSVELWYAAVKSVDELHCEGEHAYLMWCLDKMQRVASSSV